MTDFLPGIQFGDAGLEFVELLFFGLNVRRDRLGGEKRL